MAEKATRAFRFWERRDGKEVGRAWLYLIENNLHKESYGLLEDLEVLEEYQRQGIASALFAAVLAQAKEEGCYKLIATSRNDGTREEVHAWYLRLGFRTHGTEFRMDLSQ